MKWPNRFPVLMNGQIKIPSLNIFSEFSEITLLLIFSFFTAMHVSAQTSKGMSVPTVADSKIDGKTYALIVGVSKYKNPAIPQLQYADKDAIAFHDYLVSCGVDSFNIRLLLNEHATSGDFWADIDAITDQAQKGDKVFFYFSGHGDVESKVITQDAYLLPYDAPKVAYASGAIAVYLLKGYLGTLSSKGVQVVFIADACRSGNLAGGREGMENAANMLKGQWKDEIKILSCEPGELSLESKQWGNGRGLFSYELVKGLAGDADADKDGKVSLRELNIYMMQKVPEQAKPSQQNPVLTGNMAATVSDVNNNYLKSYSGADNRIAAVSTKGIEDGLLKGLPDSVKHYYADFKYLLEHGPVELWAEGFTASRKKINFSDTIYRQLLKAEGFDSLGIFHAPDSLEHYYKECIVHNDSNEFTPIFDKYGDYLGNYHRDNNNTVKKYIVSAYDYISKVPENEQTKILVGIMRRNLIASEINKVEFRIQEDIESDYFSKNNISLGELQLVHNLLGDKRIIEMGLLPKLLYLEARLNVFGNNKYSNIQLTPRGMTLLDTVIKIDSTASYALYLKSAVCYETLQQFDTAIKYAQKALSLSPDIYYCYEIIAGSYLVKGQMDSSLVYFERLRDKVYRTSYSDYVKLHIPYEVPKHDTGWVYNDAAGFYKYPLEELLFYYLINKNNDSIRKYVMEISKYYCLDSFSIVTEICKGHSYILFYRRSYDQALNCFLQNRNSLRYNASLNSMQDRNVDILIARIYAIKGDNEKALLYLKDAVDFGNVLPGVIEEEHDFDKLRLLPEFKNLLLAARSRKLLSDDELARKSCEYLPVSANFRVLGRILREDRQYDKAEKCFKKAIELEPDVAITYISYAKLSLKKDDKRSAVKFLQIALEKGFPPHDIKYDASFSSLRGIPEFSTLMKKYAPND